MQLLVILFVFAGFAFSLPAITPRQQGQKSTCDMEKVAMLVGGIQENVYIQMQELAGIKTLQALSAYNTTSAPVSGTTNQTNYQLQQQAVLVIQQKGIDIRKRNQQIAREIGSPSEQGLATVSIAQTLEMDQVKSLKGGGDMDKMKLEMLVQEVNDGTAKNMMNMQMAAKGCRK